jgi:BA14K-like protein
MSRLGILGATALSLSLAVATPALAQNAHGGGGGGMRGGGMHVGGASMGGGMHVGGGAPAFRGAQASIGAPRVGGSGVANFAGRGNGQFVQAGRGSAQFAQGGFRSDRGGFRDHDRRFGRGAGFVAGLAAGSALGYYGSYDPYYNGDDYAYNDNYDNGNYDTGYPVEPGVVVSSAGGDASYCAQRYRSYDPASGTYLGFDGLRHPCL